MLLRKRGLPEQHCLCPFNRKSLNVERETKNLTKTAKEEWVKIFNQVTETHTVRDLARKVARMTDKPIRYYDNPRNEDNENTLSIRNEKFLELGLDPITLNKGLMNEVYSVARRYSHRCDRDKIVCTSTWRPDIEPDLQSKYEERPGEITEKDARPAESSEIEPG